MHCGGRPHHSILALIPIEKRRAPLRDVNKGTSSALHSSTSTGSRTKFEETQANECEGEKEEEN